MKFKMTLIIGLLLVATVVAGLFICEPLNASEAGDRPLQEACIKATVRAIDMEIKTYERKLDTAQNGPGDSSNIPVFKKRIAELKTELEKYRAMNPDSYTPPEKKTVTVTVGQPYQEGSILGLDNMTKSGPFYHLAGIRGDDYKTLKTGQKYTMTIYPVYKRDYVLPFAANYYVYVSDYTVPFSLSPRQTGEEILEELTISPNTVTIKVGSNGCTDKNSFRVDVKKEDGITNKAPHYKLTIYRIKLDECKAIVDEGVLITFDLEKDCGLSGVYTFSIMNRVYSKLED